MTETIVAFIALAITCFIIIYVPFLDHVLAVRKYNKTHEQKIRCTSLLTCGKRYRDWYLSTFCDRKEDEKP